MGGGSCNWTCNAIAASAGPFSLIGEALDALVGPKLGEDKLLNHQPLGCATGLCFPFKGLEAVLSRLGGARHICLSHLREGPLAVVLGPIEGNYLGSFVKDGLVAVKNGQITNEIGQIGNKQWQLHSKRSLT